MAHEHMVIDVHLPLASEQEECVLLLEPLRGLVVRLQNLVSSYRACKLENAERVFEKTLEWCGIAGRLFHEPRKADLRHFLEVTMVEYQEAIFKEVSTAQHFYDWVYDRDASESEGDSDGEAAQPSASAGAGAGAGVAAGGVGKKSEAGGLVVNVADKFQEGLRFLEKYGVQAYERRRRLLLDQLAFLEHKGLVTYPTAALMEDFRQRLLDDAAASITFNAREERGGKHLISMEIRQPNEICMPPLVQEVFVDLIVHARAGSFPGTEVRASLSLDVGAKLIIVEVQDHGIGIADEEHIKQRIREGLRGGGISRSSGSFALSRAFVMAKMMGGIFSIANAAGDDSGIVYRVQFPLPE